MDKLKLGQLITEPQERDAIHMAVAPVTVAHRTAAGRHVGIDPDGKASEYVNPYVGIIDPFLSEAVPFGGRCWLVLYPGTIAGLRHEWDHPAFKAGTISHKAHATKSHEWIAEHAATLGLTADVLMENAETWLEGEDYTVQRGSERWRDNFNPLEFWHHYEVVTGNVVPADKKQSFYCCSC